VDAEALAGQFAELLGERAEMLNEYFMMDIREGQLWSVPNALGLTSDVGLKFDGLPLLLLRICAETNWDEERACLEGLCRRIADFAVEALLPDREEAQKVVASSLGPAPFSAGTDAEALTAAVEAGEFPDVVAAAMAAKSKRQRVLGPNVLQELRYLHEAIRADAGSAGSAGACRWPGAFRKDGALVKLVALEQLYRIFERC